MNSADIIAKYAPVKYGYFAHHTDMPELAQMLGSGTVTLEVDPEYPMLYGVVWIDGEDIEILAGSDVSAADAVRDALNSWSVKEAS